MALHGVLEYLWAEEGQESDLRSGMCSDNSVENELEERRPTPALIKAVGGKEMERRQSQKWCPNTSED